MISPVPAWLISPGPGGPWPLTGDGARRYFSLLGTA